MHDLWKRSLFLLNLHLAALDTAHIQHIIDQAQQMIAGRCDLSQVILHLFGIINMCRRKGCKSNDGIHRRPDIMGHIIQECRLRFVGVLCRRQCILQVRLLLLQLLFHPLLVIYINK